MKIYLIAILLIISNMSFAYTVNSCQQQVNPKFKVGNIEIDRNQLIRDADANLSSYLDYTNWRKKKKQAFMDAYWRIITAIQKGNISERNHNRCWVDRTGVISNNTKGFDANGAVCYYLDIIIDGLVERAYYEQYSAPSQSNSNNEKSQLNDITRILKK